MRYPHLSNIMNPLFILDGVLIRLLSCSYILIHGFESVQYLQIINLGE